MWFNVLLDNCWWKEFKSKMIKLLECSDSGVAMGFLGGSVFLLITVPKIYGRGCSAI